MAHQETDKEYERLFALDDADEPGNPWKVERYGQEGEPIGEIHIEIQLPVRRRLIEPQVGQLERAVRVCHTCYRRLPDDCICLG